MPSSPPDIYDSLSPSARDLLRALYSHFSCVETFYRAGAGGPNQSVRVGTKVYPTASLKELQEAKLVEPSFLRHMISNRGLDVLLGAE